MLRPLVFAASFALAALAQASAQSARCRVTDPTGTPLNIRETPGGRVVGTIPNGFVVSRAEQVNLNGRVWVFIHNPQTGSPIGWVFREFVSCW